MREIEESCVFISHSHEDIKKVRQIRNLLEAEGFDPLCFYLKCLNDDDEIEDLIKREIAAREWFIYVDSPNARASKWVAKEREYIASLGDKQIITIDLESPTPLIEAGTRLIRCLRVFILCVESDIELAEEVRKSFARKDMQTYLSVCRPADEDYLQERIESEVAKMAKAGSLVIILSKASSENKLFNGIASRAEEKDINIIPIEAEDCDTSMLGLDLPYDDKLKLHIMTAETKLRFEDTVKKIQTKLTNDLREVFSNLRMRYEED